VCNGSEADEQGLQTFERHALDDVIDLLFVAEQLAGSICACAMTDKAVKATTTNNR